MHLPSVITHRPTSSDTLSTAHTQYAQQGGSPAACALARRAVDAYLASKHGEDVCPKSSKLMTLAAPHGADFERFFTRDVLLPVLRHRAPYIPYALQVASVYLAFACHEAVARALSAEYSLRLAVWERKQCGPFALPDIMAAQCAPPMALVPTIADCTTLQRFFEDDNTIEWLAVQLMSHIRVTELCQISQCLAPLQVAQMPFVVSRVMEQCHGEAVAAFTAARAVIDPALRDRGAALHLHERLEEIVAAAYERRPLYGYMSCGKTVNLRR